MKQTILLICLATIAVPACHRPIVEQVWSIKINNASEKDIWYYISYSLPDTSLPLNRPALLSKIRKQQTAFADQRIKWESIIDTIPAKKIAIFFFEDDIVNKNSWDYIRSNYLPSKRVELSSDSLSKLNWTVIYQ